MNTKETTELDEHGQPLPNPFYNPLLSALDKIETYCQKQIEHNSEEVILWGQCKKMATDAMAINFSITLDHQEETIEMAEMHLALRELWDELECGYIIGDGKHECGLCGAKAALAEDVKHKAGCIQKLISNIGTAAQAQASLIVQLKHSIQNPRD